MNNYNLVKALEIKELNEKFLQDISLQIALTKEEMSNCYNQDEYNELSSEIEQCKRMRKMATVALVQLDMFIEENKFQFN